MFGHEKFGAYQLAIQFIAISVDILEQLPRGYSKLSDQFRRASTAVPLNIAEGSGRTTEAEKQHCYSIARGEAMECAAIIDVLTQLKLVCPQVAEKSKGLLEQIVTILSSVCRKD